MSWPWQLKPGLFPSSLQVIAIALLVSWTWPCSHALPPAPNGDQEQLPQLVTQPSLQSCQPPLFCHYVSPRNVRPAPGTNLDVWCEGKEMWNSPGLLPHCSLGLSRRNKLGFLYFVCASLSAFYLIAACTPSVHNLWMSHENIPLLLLAAKFYDVL